MADHNPEKSEDERKAELMDAMKKITEATRMGTRPLGEFVEDTSRGKITEGLSDIDWEKLDWEALKKNPQVIRELAAKAYEEYKAAKLKDVDNNPKKSEEERKSELMSKMQKTAEVAHKVTLLSPGNGSKNTSESEKLISELEKGSREDYLKRTEELISEGIEVVKEEKKDDTKKARKFQSPSGITASNWLKRAGKSVGD